MLQGRFILLKGLLHDTDLPVGVKPKCCGKEYSNNRDPMSGKFFYFHNVQGLIIWCDSTGVHEKLTIGMRGVNAHSRPRPFSDGIYRSTSYAEFLDSLRSSLMLNGTTEDRRLV